MKRSLSFLFLITVCYSMHSCTKTNNITTTVHDTTTIIHKDTIVVTNPKNPIVGLWVGTYQIDGAAYLGVYYYSFNLFADSTIIQQGGVPNGGIYLGKGSWSLSKDSVFTADLSSSDVSQGTWTQHISAKYSSAAGTLSNGIWAFTTGQTESGTFLLKRTQ